LSITDNLKPINYKKEEIMISEEERYIRTFAYIMGVMDVDGGVGITLAILL